MGISVEKFLSKYFSPKQLKEALSDIGIPVGVTKKERIGRIVENWRSHNRYWYELLDFLEWGGLSQICDDFNIPYSEYNKEETLRHKIEDARVLDFRNKSKTSTRNKSDEKPSIFNILGKNINIGSNNKINSDNTNNSTSLKIQKWQVAVGIISIIVVIGIAVYSDSESNITYEIKDGILGDLYIDQTLEFIIEKPDDTWYFETDLQKLRKSVELSEPPDDVLGGVFIVKTLSRDVVSVVVYKVPSESPTYLKERAERLIQYGITELNADETSIKRDFSSEGNYAFFSFEGVSSIPIRIGDVTKIENGKIYEIGWVIGTTKDNYQEINDDIKCIVKSFSTTIPTTNEFDLKC